MIQEFLASLSAKDMWELSQGKLDKFLTKFLLFIKTKLPENADVYINSRYLEEITNKDKAIFRAALRQGYEDCLNDIKKLWPLVVK